MPRPSDLFLHSFFQILEEPVDDPIVDSQRIAFTIPDSVIFAGGHQFPRPGLEP